MADRWSRHQPDGGQRLDQDDGEARRRDHRHRLSVRRRSEDRQTRARRVGGRQGTAPLRPLDPLHCRRGLLRRTLSEFGEYARSLTAPTTCKSKRAGSLRPFVFLRLMRSDYFGVTWIRAPGLASSSIHNEPSGPSSTSRMRWPTFLRSAISAALWQSQMMRVSDIV